MNSLPALGAAVLCWQALGLPALAQPVPLKDLLQRAIDRVPAVESAEARASAQAARVGVARSANWPQVGLASTYGRNAGLSPAPLGSLPIDGGQVGVTLRQQLWDFGRTAAQVGAAEARYEAARSQVGTLASQVGYEVRRAYLAWLEARALETQGREQLQSAEVLLKQAKAFVDAGIRPRNELTRAEVAVALAQANVVTARTSIEQAVDTLSSLTGTPVVGEPVFPDEGPLAAESLSQLEQRTATHPALAAAEAELRVAQAGTAIARRLGWPDLSGVASYALRSQEAASAPAWQVGVSLTMPVFTGFGIRSQQRAASEEEHAARADLADRRRQVRLAVDRAYLALDGARERMRVAELGARSARENAALAESRYRSGVGSILEESEGQSLLASAEAERIRARTSYHLALADMLRALGATGLEP